MQWANVGVGRLNHNYVLRVSLLDGAGQTVATTDAKADPREWLPGQYEIAESLPVPPQLKHGSYRLALALVDPIGQRRPFRLAMEAPEQDGWYTVSHVNVK